MLVANDCSSDPLTGTAASVPWLLRAAGYRVTQDLEFLDRQNFIIHAPESRRRRALDLGRTSGQNSIELVAEPPPNFGAGGGRVCRE